MRLAGIFVATSDVAPVKPLDPAGGASRGSREPVTGQSLVVREGEDVDGFSRLEIDHVVWEAFDRRLASANGELNSRDRRSCLREALDLVESAIHRGEKSVSQTGAMFFVPDSCVIEFLTGLVLRPK